jgi:hypothetical protein
MTLIKTFKSAMTYGRSKTIALPNAKPATTKSCVSGGDCPRFFLTSGAPIVTINMAANQKYRKFKFI